MTAPTANVMNRSSRHQQDYRFRSDVERNPSHYHRAPSNDLVENQSSGVARNLLGRRRVSFALPERVEIAGSSAERYARQADSGSRRFLSMTDIQADDNTSSVSSFESAANEDFVEKPRPQWNDDPQRAMQDVVTARACERATDLEAVAARSQKEPFYCANCGERDHGQSSCGHPCRHCGTQDHRSQDCAYASVPCLCTQFPRHIFDECDVECRHCWAKCLHDNEGVHHTAMSCNVWCCMYNRPITAERPHRDCRLLSDLGARRRCHDRGCHICGGYHLTQDCRIQLCRVSLR